MIADTHNLHNQVNMPPGDVLLHAGDLTMGGKHYEVEAFVDWIKDLPYKEKIVVAGNHDFYFQNKPELAEHMLAHHGIIYLKDEPFIAYGLKFYGAPWQPWFFDWAFNLQRGAEIKKKWDLIPIDTDVLITHGPPHGILDKVNGGTAGCEDLLNKIKEIKPLVSVFGHLHQGRGYYHNPEEKTHFFNATVVNEVYKVIHEPFVFDTETRRVLNGNGN